MVVVFQIRWYYSLYEEENPPPRPATSEVKLFTLQYPGWAYPCPAAEDLCRSQSP